MVICTGRQTGERGDLYTYTLANQNGMLVTVNNVGCAIQSILVRDRDGVMADVVMGYDDAETYVTNRKYYFGCILGRCASRIKDGDLIIDGRHYQLTQNAGTDHLHGGFFGFDRAIFTPEILGQDGGEALRLSYTSPDGEEGYPGIFTAKVTYQLDDQNSLIINYEGTSTADTVVNLSNHSFFNLKGHGTGTVLNHKLQIYAGSFTVVDRYGIPTGEIRSVKDTPLNFNEMIPIGKRIDSSYEQMILGNGYNHNYVIDGYGRGCVKAAELYEPESGRVMEVLTTMPGLQLFTAYRLDGMGTYKDGATYCYRGAVCLETQYHPDACHHPEFPSPVLRAGERYSHQTVYRFFSR